MDRRIGFERRRRDGARHVRPDAAPIEDAGLMRLPAILDVRCQRQAKHAQLTIDLADALDRTDQRFQRLQSEGQRLDTIDLFLQVSETLVEAMFELVTRRSLVAAPLI